MEVSTIVNKGFNSNTYVISNYPDTNEVLIIDPGEEKNELYDLIKKENYKPVYIILTHEHFDHVSGINAIKEHFPDCKLVCSALSATKITDAKGNLSHYHNKPYASVPADIIINDENYRLNWQQFAIDCFPWEGHSPGGMLILLNNKLFCGDQFLKNIKTVTNLPGSKKDKVKECFEFIKNNFSPSTLLYPGHGESLLLMNLTSF